MRQQEIDTLCDMALASLSAPAVRREALEEAASAFIREEDYPGWIIQDRIRALSTSGAEQINAAGQELPASQSETGIPSASAERVVSAQYPVPAAPSRERELAEAKKLLERALNSTRDGWADKALTQQVTALLASKEHTDERG